MRLEMDQHSYSITDPADQPQTTKVLFIGVGRQLGMLSVDGIQPGGIGLLEGYINLTDPETGEVTRFVVVEFSKQQVWTLVSRTYLEQLSIREIQEREIAGLPEKYRYGVRHANADREALEEAKRYGGFAPPPPPKPKPPTPQPPDETNLEELKRLYPDLWGDDDDADNPPASV